MSTGVQSYLTSACEVFGVARKRSVPAEKYSYRSTKKANVFKAKRLIEKRVPATSTRCPDHLSRQFLTTASTFPYSSKNSSAEHLRFLYMSLCAWVCVNESVIERERERVCVCLFMWVSVYRRVRHVGKVWICSADEFLELCGKIEAPGSGSW